MQDITTAPFSHPGRRPRNEDCAREYDFKKNPVGARKLLIVADGMGGYNAGEVASRIAVDRVTEYLAKALTSITTPDDLRKALNTAITQASDDIYHKASTEPQLRGMGTTIAVVLVLADRLMIANVGDSRIYLIADGNIQRLSEDHTALAEAMKSREMTEEEIQNFPYQHAITRSLGERAAPRVHMRTLLLPRDAVIILCSDGLTDAVPDDDILRQTLGIADLQATVDNLGRLAYHQGSADNITIQAVEIGNLKRMGGEVNRENAIPAATEPDAVRNKKPRYRAALTITCLALISTASAAFYLYYDMSQSPVHRQKQMIESTNEHRKTDMQADGQTIPAAKPDLSTPGSSLLEEIRKKPVPPVKPQEKVPPAKADKAPSKGPVGSPPAPPPMETTVKPATTTPAPQTAASSQTPPQPTAPAGTRTTTAITVAPAHPNTQAPKKPDEKAITSPEGLVDKGKTGVAEPPKPLSPPVPVQAPPKPLQPPATVQAPPKPPEQSKNAAENSRDLPGKKSPPDAPKQTQTQPPVNNEQKGITSDLESKFRQKKPDAKKAKPGPDANDWVLKVGE